MTTFERRQRILVLLRDRPGIKVTELAGVLDVSEGTIRNDLNALEESGRVMRVRGGAVVKAEPRPEHPAVPDVAAATPKQRIAQWASDLVASGDSILLDASTTVFSMVPYLLERRNLTVVTNGLETGLAMADNPTNTVIILGGVLRPGSRWLAGHLGESNLEQLHVRTAFISAAGFSPDVGFTEIDHAAAQLKRRMIASADHVVALVDSSKFGHVDLTPFATTADVDRIYTDSEVDPRYIDQLQRSCAVVTVCDRESITSYTPCDQGAQAPRHYRIGFANLIESGIPFALDVRRGLEQAAAEAGNVDLVLADNQLDGEVALHVADKLVAAGVDLAIEYQIDEKAGSLIMEKFSRAGIPVIAVDIPMIGATFYGVNNYQAGHVAGRALGEWIRRHWHGKLDKLLILQEPRAGALPAIRIQGQLDGLTEIIGAVPAASHVTIDSGNVRGVSEANTRAALEQFVGPDECFAVVSFNDDAAVGAIDAIRSAGRQRHAVVVGQGCDRLGRAELRRPDSLLIGSTAYMPERYGARLIQLAQRIVAHEPVPPAVYGEHTFVTRENLDAFYPSEPELAPWPQRAQEGR